jgi:hypothetical protein
MITCLALTVQQVPYVYTISEPNTMLMVNKLDILCGEIAFVQASTTRTCTMNNEYRGLHQRRYPSQFWLYPY